jgi:hypothetical protein
MINYQSRKERIALRYLILMGNATRSREICNPPPRLISRIANPARAHFSILRNGLSTPRWMPRAQERHHTLKMNTSRSRGICNRPPRLVSRIANPAEPICLSSGMDYKLQDGCLALKRDTTRSRRIPRDQERYLAIKMDTSRSRGICNPPPRLVSRIANPARAHFSILRNDYKLSSAAASKPVLTGKSGSRICS